MRAHAESRDRPSRGAAEVEPPPSSQCGQRRRRAPNLSKDGRLTLLAQDVLWSSRSIRASVVSLREMLLRPLAARLGGRVTAQRRRHPMRRDHRARRATTTSVVRCGGNRPRSGWLAHNAVRPQRRQRQNGAKPAALHGDGLRAHVLEQQQHAAAAAVRPRKSFRGTLEKVPGTAAVDAIQRSRPRVCRGPRTATFIDGNVQRRRSTRRCHGMRARPRRIGRSLSARRRAALGQHATIIIHAVVSHHRLRAARERRWPRRRRQLRQASTRATMLVVAMREDAEWFHPMFITKKQRWSGGERAAGDRRSTSGGCAEGAQGAPCQWFAGAVCGAGIGGDTRTGFGAAKRPG